MTKKIIYFMIISLLFLFQQAKSEMKYDGTDINGIQDIVIDIQNGHEQWRNEANKRIKKYRMGTLQIIVKDNKGNPIKNANIQIKLKNHHFFFGGAISARILTGQNTRLKNLTKKFIPVFFNKVGFQNALKPKQKARWEKHLPSLLKWCHSQNLPVRGHTLMWPGWRHLSLEFFKSKNNKKKLKALCNEQVADYARKWDVVEWDVINEPRGNHAIQDIIGTDSMVEWFKIAKKNVKNKNALLFLNENRVISAPFRQHANIEIYYNTAKYLLEKGAPLTALGFQSRFHENTPAKTIFKRLNKFNKFNLPIGATEFEIVNTDEYEQALMTERVMTIYFSHPLVFEIIAWTFIRHKKNRGLLHSDGSLTLPGKVWLYLTKQRWNTDIKNKTNKNGKLSAQCFLGTYIITVSKNGKTKKYKFNLDKKSKSVKLIF